MFGGRGEVLIVLFTQRTTIVQEQHDMAVQGDAMQQPNKQQEASLHGALGGARKAHECSNGHLGSGHIRSRSRQGLWVRPLV